MAPWYPNLMEGVKSSHRSAALITNRHLQKRQQQEELPCNPHSLTVQCKACMPHYPALYRYKLCLSNPLCHINRANHTDTPYTDSVENLSAISGPEALTTVRRHMYSGSECTLTDDISLVDICLPHSQIVLWDGFYPGKLATPPEWSPSGSRSYVRTVPMETETAT